MMFEGFQKKFKRDATFSVKNAARATHSEIAGLNDLLDQFGGASFGKGLYRVVRASDVDAWNARVGYAFPEFRERITCFGFDWLGRVFAIDSGRSEDGQPGVLMFEPGTGDALEIPCNIHSFHDQELIEYRDAALASNFHKRWLAKGGSIPQHAQCVGYKKPLFLSGADELDNLAISDIEVYWHLYGQLILNFRHLPPGTPVHIHGIG